MMKPNVKLFGERNTGTRAMLDMLRATRAVNLRLPTDDGVHKLSDKIELTTAITAYYDDAWRKLFLDALRDHDDYRAVPLAAWKHAAPVWHSDFETHRVHVMFTVRNPYSWAVSMARRPYHIAGPRTPDFATFLRRPWLTQRRDNTEPLLASVIDLWNVKFRAFVDFQGRAARAGVETALIKFEDFVADPEATVSETLFNWGAAQTHVRAQKKSTKGEGQSLEKLQSYYNAEGWRQYHTCETIEAINAGLDWELMDRAGYALLRADDFPTALPKGVQNRFSREMMSLVAAKARLNREAGAATAA